MTDLEKNIINALRLSDAAAAALHDMIQYYIEVARADMIRSGIASDMANDDTNMLVMNIIVKYVTSEMTTIESERDKALIAYKICLDELRKTQC